MKIELLQNIIDVIRGKKKPGNIQGKNNNIILPKKKHDIKLSINGNNNTVKLPPKSCINVLIYGNNNSVLFDDDIAGFGANIKIGTSDAPVTNCQIRVGKGSTSNGCSFMLLDDNNSVIIGENCMFSSGVQIWASDAHAITDYSGKLLNAGKEINIGNNVWIGISALILKNSKIPDNCVVGVRSLVNKKFDNTTNCIIAGSPAKIVKENICWHRCRPNEYLR